MLERLYLPEKHLQLQVLQGQLLCALGIGPGAISAGPGLLQLPVL